MKLDKAETEIALGCESSKQNSKRLARVQQIAVQQRCFISTIYFCGQVSDLRSGKISVEMRKTFVVQSGQSRDFGTSVFMP